MGFLNKFLQFLAIQSEMYDRAPRKMTSIIGSTPDHVGPGSYTQHGSNIKQLRGEGYAPFMSLTSRDTFCMPTEGTITAPGPGYYDPEFPHQPTKGVCFLHSKSKRFSDKSAETPGPGAYNTNMPTSAPPKLESVPASHNLYSTRVKFQRKPVAPSIPCPGQAYGFEENEDGSLKKQVPPSRDKSLGPAYYSPAVEDTMTTKLYKGVHFGQMKAGRMKIEVKDGPGPGQYDPVTEQKPAADIMNIDKTRFESKIPRYLEQIVQNEEKMGVPGPGQYKITREFDSTPAVRMKLESMPVEQPPFLSQAKRFEAVKSDAPPPGKYNDPRTAMEALKKISGLKRSPFGQTSVRFERDQNSKLPGPGSYNMLGMGAESIYKAYLASTRRGAFGSTSERMIAAVNKNEPDLPGPAHYQIVQRPYQSKFVHVSSTFAPKQKQLENRLEEAMDAPAPGSYNVEESFQKTQGKISPMPPRTEAAKKRHGGFKTSSQRFAPPRDVIIAEPDPSLPGPGMYNPTFVDKCGWNVIIPKDTRFKEKFESTPGPGTYELSPMIQDSVLKGTFNATLNNPMAGLLSAREEKVC